MNDPIVIDMTPFRALVGMGMPDAYSITRTTEVPDDAGGRTETEATVESGYCAFRPALTGSEQVIAEQSKVTAVAAADLPWSTVLEPADDIVIGGRRFEVMHVARGGEYGVKVTAILQETT